jgi:putative FmdB family regulatory protein
MKPLKGIVLAYSEYLQPGDRVDCWFVAHKTKGVRMPIYDYTCKKCSQTFELLLMSSTIPACPSCGGRKLQKLISAPTAPGKSAGIMAAGRVRAAKEGHTVNYKHSNGKIVD